jgi:hypothetical protein
MTRSFALLLAWLPAVAALGQAPPPTSPPQGPQMTLGKMLCGNEGLPPTSTEIPTVGCFGVPSGGSARGVFDGHKFLVTVDAAGEAKCRFDGAANECSGCIGQSVPQCPVMLLVLSHNADKSVSFNVQRKADGNAYLYGIDAWNSYLARSKSKREVEAAQAQTAPPEVPPVPPGMGAVSVEPTDGPAVLFAIGWKAQGAYASGQFAKLDALIETLSQPDQLTDDGVPRLQGVLVGLESFLDAWKSWQSDFDRIAQWHKEEPDSYGADLVEVAAWMTWAWHARGDGFASTVTPEGWKLFGERLAHAEQVLHRCKARAMKSPLWYQLSLVIARDSGWDRTRYQALLDEATRRFPWYINFYISTSIYLSPKWGGSYEALDEFARQTVGTQLGSDHSLYTRVYWTLTENAMRDFQPFQDSKAAWPLMRAGFEGLMNRYPKSKWNLNAYAYFACRADDGSTYGALRARIGRDVIPDAWASNYSTEVCDERLLGHT